MKLTTTGVALVILGSLGVNVPSAEGYSLQDVRTSLLSTSSKNTSSSVKTNLEERILEEIVILSKRGFQLPLLAESDLELIKDSKRCPDCSQTVQSLSDAVLRKQIPNSIQFLAAIDPNNLVVADILKAVPELASTFENLSNLRQGLRSLSNTSNVVFRPLATVTQDANGQPQVQIANGASNTADQTRDALRANILYNFFNLEAQSSQTGQAGDASTLPDQPYNRFVAAEGDSQRWLTLQEAAKEVWSSVNAAASRVTQAGADAVRGAGSTLVDTAIGTAANAATSYENFTWSSLIGPPPPSKDPTTPPVANPSPPVAGNTPGGNTSLVDPNAAPIKSAEELKAAGFIAPTSAQDAALIRLNGLVDSGDSKKSSSTSSVSSVELPDDKIPSELIPVALPDQTVSGLSSVRLNNIITPTEDESIHVEKLNLEDAPLDCERLGTVGCDGLQTR